MAVALATPKVAGKRDRDRATAAKAPPPKPAAKKAPPPAPIKGGKVAPPPAAKPKAPAEPGVRAKSWARGIKLVQKENPRRPGTFGHMRYELYRRVKTVGEFLSAGGTMQDAQRDAAHGYIEIK